MPRKTKFIINVEVLFHLDIDFDWLFLLVVVEQFDLRLQ